MLSHRSENSLPMLESQTIKASLSPKTEEDDNNKPGHPFVDGESVAGVGKLRRPRVERQLIRRGHLKWDREEVHSHLCYFRARGQEGEEIKDDRREW